MARTTPYAAFNFIVTVGTGEAFGGFSDVSGLQTEITVAEYRTGNEKLNHARKVQGIHKVGDVTLKRGIVNSADLWSWIQDTRKECPDVEPPQCNSAEIYRANLSRKRRRRRCHGGVGALLGRPGSGRRLSLENL